MEKVIYIVNEYGDWDGDFCSSMAFDTKEKAEEYYQQAIEDAKEQYCEYEGEYETAQGNYSFCLWLSSDTEYYHKITIKRTEIQE